jgi:5'-nucleotidase
VPRPALLGCALLLAAVLVRSIPAQSAGAALSADPWPPPADAVSWSVTDTHGSPLVHLRVLGFNDFHGNLQPPATGSVRPVGGAVALAAYLKAAGAGMPDRTLIVHAGDQVGASPPATRLLRNEPGIEFLNLLANRYCRGAAANAGSAAPDWRRHPNRCNVVGTLGNHEFDAGVDEIHRLLHGGNAPDGPFLENPYPGSRVPYVCANVRDRRTGRLLLPAYTVVSLGGVPVGIVGAVLHDTPSIVPGWAVRELEFMDEAQSINEAVAQLQSQGVHTIVVIIHQGLTPMAGDATHYSGPLRELVARLDPDVDVVVSGHTHHFTNTLLPSRAGTPILVTQAYSYGVAFAQIDLTVNTRTRDVVAKSARVVPTWADVSPGVPGDTAARALVDAAQALVADRVKRVVTILPQALTRMVTDAGESELGDVVADAQRSALHADMALMNPGGLRSDLLAGAVTWGDILTLHPFGNHLVLVDMTGQQLHELLEQQWPADRAGPVRILKTSGLRYTWDATAPTGARVQHACDDHGDVLDAARHYRVAVSDYLAAGGDDFSVLTTLTPLQTGPTDSEALDRYLQAGLPGGVPSSGRLSRSDLHEPDPCDGAAN